ncbi:hypothetical protein ACFVXG_09605 [Kitasatospora sp. NPDC058162]|uniref:hypothetical protein n=1 Tax=Kitasatospora sp. NPDC058162 TaxID=3346362 RepID=UPI0036DDE00F
MRLNRAQVVISVVALAVLAAGCSNDTKAGGDSDNVGEPVVPQIGADPADGSPVTHPLDGYSVGAEESALIFRAMGQATRTCMTAKGFDYDPGPVSTPPPPTPIDTSLLGLLSVSAAQQTGYHRPPRPGGNGTSGTGNPSGQGPEYQKALMGDHGTKAGAADPKADRGCMGEFERRLQAEGVKNTASDLVGTLRAKAYDHAAVDSRVRAALADWQSCMTKLGYNYANPVQASSAAWPEQVSQEERDTAVADMNCKEQVKLLGTWNAVLTAYQQVYISRNEQALQADREISQQRIAAAKKLLGQA